MTNCHWHAFEVGMGRSYYIIILLLPKGCLHNKSRLFRLFVPFSAFQSGRHRIYPFDLFQWFFVIRFSHVNVVDIHHIMLISLFSETSFTFTNLSVTWLQGLTDSAFNISDCFIPQMLCLIGESFDGESVLVNGAVVNVRNRVTVIIMVITIVT